MADETDPKTSGKGPGLMSLIKAVAVISVLVILQLAAASMILPSAAETTEIASELANASMEEDAAEESEPASTEVTRMLAMGEIAEVALGLYHVLSYNPDTGTKTNIDFELYGTVLDDEESEFFDLFAANEQRIREQILVTVRGTDMTDLTDPTLSLVKRKLLERANRALGKPLLQELIVSKFSFEER